MAALFLIFCLWLESQLISANNRPLLSPAISCFRMTNMAAHPFRTVDVFQKLRFNHRRTAHESSHWGLWTTFTLMAAAATTTLAIHFYGSVSSSCRRNASQVQKKTTKQRSKSQDNVLKPKAERNACNHLTINERIFSISWKIISHCEEISNFVYKFFLRNGVKLQIMLFKWTEKCFLMFNMYFLTNKNKTKYDCQR